MQRVFACFPGIASIFKYSFSFLVTILIVPIIIGITKHCSGPGSSVGIATDYGMDGP